MKRTLISVFCAVCVMLMLMNTVYCAESESNTVKTIIQNAEVMANDPSEENMEIFISGLEGWGVSDSSDEGTDGNSESSLAGTMTYSELGPTANTQLMLAKLQLEMSESTQQAVMQNTVRVEELQSQQREISEVLNRLRELLSGLDGDTTQLPDDLAVSLVELGICPENHSALSKSELDSEDIADLICLAEARMEELGAEVQQTMVYIQDFMGQYNSYLEGTNNINSSDSQTLTNLSRGATMSGSGSSMLFTGLLAGAVLGILGTIIVRRASKKGREE